MNWPERRRGKKNKKRKVKLQLSQIQTQIVFLPLIKWPCIFVSVYNLYR